MAKMEKKVAELEEKLVRSVGVELKSSAATTEQNQTPIQQSPTAALDFDLSVSGNYYSMINVAALFLSQEIPSSGPPLFP